MTHSFLYLGERFPRLRTRHVAPTEKRTRATGTAGASANFVRVENSNTIWTQLITGLHKRSAERRWRHDLLALDERLLKDIGVSRTEAEQAAGRPGVWI